MAHPAVTPHSATETLDARTAAPRYLKLQHRVQPGEMARN